ncbi:hypothetical protein LC040_01945 [Bacillus tianshenii]|nr:hypothetical protein LC040_01945 [Bacillus tianshenii]
MPNEKRNTHSEVSPHSDGAREGINNDSNGTQFSITMNPVDDFSQEKNPFDAKLRENKEMKKLGRLLQEE